MTTPPSADDPSPVSGLEASIPVTEEAYEVPAIEFQRLSGLAEADALGGARVAIRRGGALLLVRTVDAADEWAAPGGERQPDETHSETAVRAAKVETGLEITPAEPLAAKRVTFEHEHAPGREVTGLWVWYGADDSGGPATPADPSVVSTGWFTEVPPGVDAAAASAIEAWVERERERANASDDATRSAGD